MREYKREFNGRRPPYFLNIFNFKQFHLCILKRKQLMIIVTRSVNEFGSIEFGRYSQSNVNIFFSWFG